MSRSRRAGRLLASAAVVLAGCAAPRAGEPMPVPPESRPLVTPSLAPAPSGSSCARIDRDPCREWRPLEPKPSFFDLLRLGPRSPAPDGSSWGSLYLCGALSDDQLTDGLGEDFARAVLNDFNCWMESADRSRLLSVYFGNGSLDEFARERFGLEKTRTTIHGRDAVVYEHEPNESFVDHDYVLAIPRLDDTVLVVDVSFASTYQRDPFDIIPPDPEAARNFFDTVAETLIDLSE